MDTRHFLDIGETAPESIGQKSPDLGYLPRAVSAPDPFPNYLLYGSPVCTIHPA